MSGRLQLGYGLKLAASHVALVVAVGTAVLLLIDRQLGADLLAALDARLEAQARGAAAWTAEGRHPERLAARLGRIVDAHVTILDAGGRVLGDSEPAVALGSDESRAPEVAVLLAGGTGRATRNEGGIETRFVAVRAAPGVVLRLGASTSTIRGALRQFRTRLAVAAGLGILLALVLSALASRLAARPLRTMRDAAHRIAQGDYSFRPATLTPDEFGELDRSLRQLAARLAADRARIERLETTRRDFVANVSHELRTPLTAIRGYAETLLAGGVDADTASRFLSTMHRQATRLGALVTDLLRLSEIEARAPSDQRFGRVRVEDVAREAASTVVEIRPGRPSIAIDIGGDPSVRGDAAWVEQILENLLENAVRHGGGSDVRVSAHAEGERARITVADSGPGISPEDLPRVFERFYRGRAGSRGEGGAGLGLSIVKHLAEAMNGCVSVESEVGRGARFIVELPLDAGPAIPRGRRPSPDHSS